MVFTTFWAVFFIIIFCIVGVVLFVIGYFGGGFKMQTEEEWELVRLQYETLYEEEVISLGDSNWKKDLPGYMATFCQAIDYTIRDLFSTIFIYMVIGVFVVIIVITIWLTPVKTFFPFFLCLIWGVGVFTLCAYFILIITVGTINKMPTRARDFREDAIKFAYGNGFFLSLFIVALILSNLLFLVSIMQAIFLGERNVVNYRRMGVSLMGYPFGMILASFFFREATSLASRGVTIATDLIIRNDRFIAELGNMVSYTAKVSSIVASLLANIVTNYLDATIVISLFVTLPFIISSQSIEIQKSDHLYGILLGPSLVLSFNMIGAIISSFLISMSADPETSSFTAKNIRTQIILSSTFSLITVLIFMNFITPEIFTFGIDEFPTLRSLHGTSVGMMVCGLLGLVTNIILLILFEFLTSHGFQPVRTLSKSAENAPTLNVIQAYSFGYITQSFSIVLLGLLFTVCYKLAGLIGILGGLTGFIMNIMILLPILFLSGASHEGCRCATIAQIAQPIIERIHKIAWASRNYQIYLRLTNTGCLFFIGILLIGATMEFGQTRFDVIGSGWTLFGFLLGASLTFINKGMSIQAVKVITESCLHQERIMQNQRGTEFQDDAMNNYADNFFPSMYKSGLETLLINFSVSTLVICSNGLLFGLSSAIALQSSNLLMTIIMMFISLITGTGLKNSRLFNQYDPKFTQASQVFASHLYGDIQGMALEESQCIPLIIFTSYNILLTFVGYEIFEKTGWIK